MKKFFLIFISLCFLFILSCKKEYAVIDGTSKDKFTESLASVSSKLTILQQDKMEEAIKLIYKFKTLGTDENNKWEQLYQLLNGKNAEQIFNIAEEVAIENKISWSTTSMNSLDESVFEEQLKPLTKEEEQLKQIELATRINLRFSPANPDTTLNDGFILYPDLVDDAGQTITYSNLNLDLTISFINNGTAVYVTNRKLSSSEVGNLALKKGIKIPYSMFDRQKIANASLDVEVKASAGDKYLYGKLGGIPIDINKTRETTTSLEDELNSQKAMESVKSFIQDVGAKNYAQAYSLTKNPKWETEEKFSSTSNGFGAIEATNLLATEVAKSTKDIITISAIYQIKDKSGAVKTLKQNFILKKENEKWVITDTETSEVKNDVWK